MKFKYILEEKIILEQIKEIINNHRNLIIALILLYILGFIHRIIKNIIKEKKKK